MLAACGQVSGSGGAGLDQLPTSGAAGGSPAPGALTVVAGENFWGDIAAQIGGRHVA